MKIWSKVLNKKLFNQTRDFASRAVSLAKLSHIFMTLRLCKQRLYRFYLFLCDVHRIHAWYTLGYYMDSFTEPAGSCRNVVVINSVSQTGEYIMYIGYVYRLYHVYKL